MPVNITVQKGRLARDVKFTKSEVKDTQDRVWGVICVPEMDKNKEPNYFQFSCWGKLARAMRDHTEKGKEVTITGSWRQRTNSKEGDERRDYYEIRAASVDFGPSAKKNQPNAGMDDETMAKLAKQVAAIQKSGNADAGAEAQPKAEEQEQQPTGEELSGAGDGNNPFG